MILGYRNSREGGGIASTSFFNPRSWLLQSMIRAVSYVSVLHNIPGLKETVRTLAMIGVTLPRVSAENGLMAMDVSLASSPSITTME